MYEGLFSQVSIGGVDLSNRVAMTAMGVNLAAPGGGVNDDIIAFYEARAAGGVGLIITGICRVLDGTGAGEAGQLAARGGQDIGGLQRLADSVHKYGTRIFLQLHHPGWNYALGPEQPVAASAVTHPFGGRTPRALSVEEVHDVQRAFVTGAVIAQTAGIDGVEFHGTHGYLINSFLSPYLNHRDDAYGGDLTSRLRFVTEILQQARALVGPMFPMGVRISGEEFLGDEGTDLAEAARIAVGLESAGADFIDVSCIGFAPGSPGLTACIEPGTFPQGWKKYMAEKIRAHVSIPVIAVANVKDPEVAEQMLAEGACDIVGVARGHLADPDWCRKARSGRADTITPCIGCLVCFDEIEHGRHVTCSVNPRTGREREFAHPRRNGGDRIVAVVGGGPAGVTAAVVLRERGFRPVLFTTEERLGGTLNVADRGLDKQRISRLSDHFNALVERHDIQVHLGPATVEHVATLNPCGVFVACGAEPLRPDLPGLQRANVVTAEAVLLERAPANGTCVVVGSGMTGLETAEVLLKAGHQVTVVEMAPVIGRGAEPIVILDLLTRMAECAPTMLPGHRVVGVTETSVSVVEVATGRRRHLPADTVVLALGVRPRPQVAAFLDAFPDAVVVGDARAGGRIVDAVQDAYERAFVFTAEEEGSGGYD